MNKDILHKGEQFCNKDPIAPKHGCYNVRTRSSISMHILLVMAEWTLKGTTFEESTLNKKMLI